MNLFERIESLCNLKGITVYRLCQELGVRSSMLSDLKFGRKKSLNARLLNQIAEYFNVSVDFLINGKETEDTDLHFIPVLGYVKAGIPTEAVEDIIGYEEVTAEMEKDHFALKIKGDSMSPRFCEGDVAIVKCQEDVANNEIAVILIGDETTVKKVVRKENSLMLVPTNPSYDPMFYSPEEVESLPVRIIGKVVELRCKF